MELTCTRQLIFLCAFALLVLQHISKKRSCFWRDGIGLVQTMVNGVLKALLSLGLVDAQR